MKETDLRIGNLVNVPIFNEVKIKCFIYDEIKFISGDDGRTQNIPISEVEPIPLTEEWLLKFGFYQTSIPNVYYKNWGTNGIEIIIFEYHYKGGFEYELGKGKYKVLESVHQLQNLYHSLTGEELTLK